MIYDGNVKRTGDERFCLSGSQTSKDLLEFWRWAYSRLNSNVIRSVLAEYIVALALKMPLDAARDPWAPVDLDAPGWPKIEVKASAYWQDWPQKAGPTKVVFNYAATRKWDPGTGDLSPTKSRAAEVYVFCLHSPGAKEDIDPLNLDLWRFFVVGRNTLNTRARSTDSITLQSLKELTDGGVAFRELGEAVRRVSRA